MMPAARGRGGGLAFGDSAGITISKFQDFSRGQGATILFAAGPERARFVAGQRMRQPSGAPPYGLLLNLVIRSARSNLTLALWSV